MARPKETFEAFVIGQHEVPNRFKHLDLGEVLVHNVTRDTYRVLTVSEFNAQFEWV